MATIRRITFVLLAPIFVGLGCDAPPTPTSVPDGIESRPLLGVSLDLSLSSLATLRRTEDVEEGLCAEDVAVGPEGGEVACPEAGLLLVFPRRALSETTEISVRIPRGDLVGYEFAPHGLRFEKKVELIQALEGTEAEENGGILGDLVGAYVDEIDDLVDPMETLTASLLGGSSDADDPEAVRIKIKHFSGYVCATS